MSAQEIYALEKIKFTVYEVNRIMDLVVSPRGKKEAEYKRFEECIKTDLQAIEGLLASLSARPVHQHEPDLRRLIEDELLFFSADGVRCPDKIDDAKDLGQLYAEDPNWWTARMITRLNELRNGIQPLLDEVVKRHTKDVAMLYVDAVESSATPEGVYQHARKRSIEFLRAHGGRVPAPRIMEPGNDELYAMFDTCDAALAAAVKLQDRARMVHYSLAQQEKTLGYRIGLHWAKGIVERGGHCPLYTKEIRLAKRMRDLNEDFRARGVTYCTSDFFAQLTASAKNGEAGGALCRHAGTIRLKPHEEVLGEVWEVLLPSDPKPECPDGCMISHATIPRLNA